jgi:isobutyryl-CoA mutase
MSSVTTTKVRLITAASLFDGHDAAINIMRRILQSKGAEIIHLGHNRSALEIVEAAIEEDVHGIAITSYQGGHVEFFKYIKDLLDQNNSGHIKIFGGGGGTILPSEIEELHSYGITKIYSPDDGREMGLEGMIAEVIALCKPPHPPKWGLDKTSTKTNNALNEERDIITIAKAITLAENGEDYAQQLSSLKNNQAAIQTPPLEGQGEAMGGAVLGITGTGGAGKSSVTDEIVRRFLNTFTSKTIAVISVDPSKKKTGGALLGDRIRMNAISNTRAYMRSLATRDSEIALSPYVKDAIDICKAAAFDLIIVESAGVGQSDASILEFVDASLYVMTPEYGAASQLEKINMLDYADVIAINKFDKAGALDALMEVRKQYKRNHNLFTAKDEDLPIYGTMASKFGDDGTDKLFEKLIATMENKTAIKFERLNSFSIGEGGDGAAIIPPSRVRYLSEISETIRSYDKWVEEQSAIATKMYQVDGAIKIVE